MLNEWFDFFFPETCAFCREQTDTDWGVCMECETTLPWFEPPWCDACGRPLDAGGDPTVLCGDCSDRRPVFGKAFSIVAYEDSVQKTVAAMKYGRNDGAAVALGQTTLRSLPRLINPFLYDVVTAVPLHTERYRWRGFNQAAVIGRQVSKRFHLNFQGNLIIRRRKTSAQAGLDREGRMHNLAGAFQADAKSAKNKRILLIDDVMTTGATAEAVAATLFETGASQVDVLTIARALPGRAP